MRLMMLCLFLLFSAVKAQATPEDYCAAYARDFADLGPAEQHQMRKDNAKADCLLAVSPPVAKPIEKVKVVTAPPIVKPTIPVAKIVEANKPALSKPILQSGSIAWLDYCDKKYASFNRITGTYTSYKGLERKCLVTAE